MTQRTEAPLPRPRCSTHRYQLNRTTRIRARTPPDRRVADRRTARSPPLPSAVRARRMAACSAKWVVACGPRTCSPGHSKHDPQGGIEVSYRGGGAASAFPDGHLRMGLASRPWPRHPLTGSAGGHCLAPGLRSDGFQHDRAAGDHLRRGPIAYQLTGNARDGRRLTVALEPGSYVEPETGRRASSWLPRVSATIRSRTRSSTGPLITKSSSARASRSLSPGTTSSGSPANSCSSPGHAPRKPTRAAPPKGDAQRTQASAPRLDQATAHHRQRRPAAPPRLPLTAG